MGLGEVKFFTKNSTPKLNNLDFLSGAKQAAKQLKECFDDFASSFSPACEEGAIPASMQLKTAEEIMSQHNGQMPAMGLEAPEVRAAEVELSSVEADVMTSNKNAEKGLDNAKNNADKNNQVAQNAVNSAESTAQSENAKAKSQTEATKSQAEEQTEAAKGQLQETKNSVAEATNNAQSEVERANQSLTNIQDAYNNAQNVLAGAEGNLSELQALLVNTPENEKEAIQAKIAEAERVLAEAKAQVENKKSELDQATQALENAKSNLERVKQDGERSIQDSEQNVENVEREGANNIAQAQNNAEQVKQTGEENILAAQEGAKNIANDGEISITKAEDNVEDVKISGENAVNNAEQELKTAEEDASKLSWEEMNDALKSNTFDNKIYNEEEYQKAIDSINKDNVMDFQPSIEAVNRSAEEYNADLQKFSDALLEKAKELGVDTSDIKFKEYNQKDAVEFEENGEKYKFDGQVVFENNQQLRALYQRCNEAQFMYENAAAAEKVMNYKNRDLLVDAVDSTYAALGGQTKPNGVSGVDFVNGKLDGVSAQETGNCWIHAPLNSIASTQAGNNMLASHMYRDTERGITAVHLQGAENLGLGHNGTGIYTFTDAEIAAAQETLSSGDGDMTAYNLALQKFFSETGVTQFVGRGGETKHVLDAIMGQGYYFSDSPYEYSIGTTSDQSFEKVVQMASNGNSATTFSINQHAVSVVGTTEDGNILVQESNNNGLNISDLPRYSGSTYNGAPTYVMDKNAFEEKVEASTHFYWKK